MKEFAKKVRMFFNKKKFKYGGYAVIMTAGVVAVIVLLNLLLIYLDNKFTMSIDLTANRVYSLTKQTEYIIDDLSQDIYIYTFSGEDSEDETLSELLDRYMSGSKYIHLKNINLVNNPGAVTYYEQEKNISVSYSSLVVSDSEDPANPKQTFKVLDFYDIYSYDSETQQYTMFTGEDAVTGAIKYVLNPNTPKVWFLEGHGATSSTWSEMASYLEDENYDTGSISLVTEPDSLEKGDILIVLAPKNDLSNDEREILLDFALDGGKIMFLFNPGTVEDLPNFMLILSHYNIEMEDGVIFEDANNQQAYYYDPAYIVPTLVSHSTTSPLISNNYSLLVPQPGALSIGPDQTGITIDVLMQTSDGSYIEPITSDMDGVKDDDAQTGPFPLAVAVTKTAGADTEEVKMIVTGDAAMFAQIANTQSRGNYELFLNTIGWLSPIEDNFYIRGKSLQASVLYFQSNAQVSTVVVIVCIVLPLLAFAAALVVYLKRRHL